MNHFVQPPDAPPPSPESRVDGPVVPQLVPPASSGRRGRGLGRLIGSRARGRGAHAAPTPAPTTAPTIQYAQTQWGAGAAAAPSPRTRAKGGSDLTKLILLVVVLLIALGGIAMASGVLQFGAPDSVGVGAAGGSKTSSLTGDTWSYYHDQSYDTNNGGPNYDTDHSRSTDPNEAVIGDTSRWEYDGSYNYGPYGSDGMQQRASGKTSTDPLYSQANPSPDVFQEYGGNLDPAGDQPVGMPAANFTNPYYDPYAGYSNPYANRLRLAYGEGYDRGTTPVP